MELSEKNKLLKKTKDYLLSIGYNLKESDSIINSLIYAEMHGVKSHGFNRIFSGFLKKIIDKSMVESNQEPILIDKDNGFITYDGNFSVGYHGIKLVLRKIVEELEVNNIVFCNINNMYPTNCLAEYASYLNDYGAICYITSKSPDRVTSPIDFQKEISDIKPSIGTNAYAWGFPSINSEHVIFDTSMAATTNGELLRIKNGLDDNFNSDNYLTSSYNRPKSPEELFENEDFSGYILPFGGEKNYKGFGNLLPAEMFNLFQSNNLIGTSTTIIAIKVQDRVQYSEKLNQYKEKVKNSTTYTDGTITMLPFERKKKLYVQNNIEEITQKYKEEIDNLPTSQNRIKDLGFTNERIVGENAFDINVFKEKSIEDVINKFIDITDLSIGNGDLKKYAFNLLSEEEFFDRWCDETYELPKLPDHKTLLSNIIDKVEFNSKDVILDLGSGDGKLLDIIPLCSEVDCFDISKKMLQKIEGKKDKFQFTINTKHGDFLEYKFNKKYSKIIAIMSLHHIKEINKAIKKSYKILNEDGYLIIGETFLDSINLNSPENIRNISSLYLRKMVNCFNNNCLKHALKEIQILKKILYSQGEYMLPMNIWKDTLRSNGFQVLNAQLTSPLIKYGYIIARKL
ncbi:Ldh family oxidoreductase [Bacillus alkalicellulosilyticus]|uniref:Ldh family oxidoreductase n=1 Tax=Alkalihalobacterium alkalicellulosilyticum TaxID=1912214 RepID=UPI0014829865|nr:Ldh family oxidoreductase [Bacillus alkalicellulosilyticus]